MTATPHASRPGVFCGVAAARRLGATTDRRRSARRPADKCGDDSGDGRRRHGVRELAERRHSGLRGRHHRRVLRRRLVLRDYCHGRLSRAAGLRSSAGPITAAATGGHRVGDQPVALPPPTNPMIRLVPRIAVFFTHLLVRLVIGVVSAMARDRRDVRVPCYQPPADKTWQKAKSDVRPDRLDPGLMHCGGWRPL